MCFPFYDRLIFLLGNAHLQVHYWSLTSSLYWLVTLSCCFFLGCGLVCLCVHDWTMKMTVFILVWPYWLWICLPHFFLKQPHRLYRDLACRWWLQYSDQAIRVRLLQAVLISRWGVMLRCQDEQGQCYWLIFFAIGSTQLDLRSLRYYINVAL